MHTQNSNTDFSIRVFFYKALVKENTSNSTSTLILTNFECIMRGLLFRFEFLPKNVDRNDLEKTFYDNQKNVILSLNGGISNLENQDCYYVTLPKNTKYYIGETECKTTETITYEIINGYFELQGHEFSISFDKKPDNICIDKKTCKLVHPSSMNPENRQHVQTQEEKSTNHVVQPIQVQEENSTNNNDKPPEIISKSELLPKNSITFETLQYEKCDMLRNDDIILKFVNGYKSHLYYNDKYGLIYMTRPNLLLQDYLSAHYKKNQHNYVLVGELYQSHNNEKIALYR